MNRTDDIHSSSIRDFQYEDYFQNYQHNGKVLSIDERNKFIKGLDESVAVYSEGLPC